MDTDNLSAIRLENDRLFDRVVSILEQARSNVVRAVNNNMVIAYWLIGREIVQEIQAGEERAEYGKRVIEQLSADLNNRYGRGFSTTNLRYFRTFYKTYSHRIPEIRHIGGGELEAVGNRHTQSGVLATMEMAVKQIGTKQGFSPNLGWSHYRALIKNCILKVVDKYRFEGYEATSAWCGGQIMSLLWKLKHWKCVRTLYCMRCFAKRGKICLQH